ncbi:MAG: (d)CMP kinase [Chloroflexota bacterium]
MGRVVAIDGPSGAGKSTVSRIVAEKLGFRFLDTGALYRAVALHLRRRGVSPEADDDSIAEALVGAVVYINGGRVHLNGEDVSEEVRTTEAGHYASVFSARKAVRDFLLGLQRESARDEDIVVEGRDMTTVVFPDAWKKFYLDASSEIRAERRYMQLREKGVSITMEGALDDVRERDERDSGRKIAPLKRAPDAVYIDTSPLSLDGVVAVMLREIGG